jgi:hypothetical protein
LTKAVSRLVTKSLQISLAISTMDVASLALAAVALAGAAKGAVDTYILMAEIFKRDDDSLHLAVLYNGEKHRLQTWMDAMQTQDPNSSKLAKLSEDIRGHIYRILADIESTQAKAARIVAKRCNSPPQPNTLAPISFTQPANAMVQQLVALNAKLPRRKRLSWSLKDKEELTKLVGALTTLNNQLKELVMPISTEMFEQSVAARVVAEIRDCSTLTVTMTATNTSATDSLTKLGLRLRELQIQAEENPTLLDSMPYKSLSFDKNGFTGTAQVAGYPMGRRVWVERRDIPATLKSEDRVKMTEWIRALGNVLQTINSARQDVFCIPDFVGIYEDLDYIKASQGLKSRWWFLYGIPDNNKLWNPLPDTQCPPGDIDFVPNPVSLMALLTHPRSQTSPPELGDRVKLALTLASSFAQLHAAGWLHKGLRSDKIWFFRSKNAPKDSLPDITKPFITGFDLSRPSTKASIEHRQKLGLDQEYYYHEKSIHGYTKIIDLYSLGIVMFEIGRWALATKGVPPEHKSPVKALQDFLLSTAVEDLGWRVGNRYKSVVKALLQGDIPDDDDETITQGFFIKVLQELNEIRV